MKAREALGSGHEMKNMKAYKIVTIGKDGKRYGLYNFLGSDIKIEYLTDGSVITPKIPNSVLFVFKELEHGNFWKRSDTELWEVECDELVEIKEYVNLPSDEEAIAFWGGRKDINKKPISILTNGDTFYGCSSLRLVKQIV